MNPSNERTDWSDERLDALLGEFFRQEMPVELRQPQPAFRPRTAISRPAFAAPRPAAAVAPASARPVSVKRTPGAAAGLVVAAVCLAMAVVLTVGTSSRDSRRDGGTMVESRSGIPREAASPIAAAEKLVADGEFVVERVEERSQPVDRTTFQTSRGPVEQRTDLRTTNVSVFDAQTGTRVEFEVPELSIEIIPIEDDE
ncbi:MAG: hypothetical protein WD069_05895 [Planctomycetales bacterium]